MSASIHARGPLAWQVAGATLGLAIVSAMLASASAQAIVLTMAALAGLTVMLVFREVRRPLLGALFVLAPIDISKAVIAPLTSRYFADGPYFSPGLYMSLAHMALVALLLCWLGRHLLVHRRLPALTMLDVLVFAYLAFIWLRSIGTPQGILSIGSAASYSLAVLGFYASSHAIVDRSDLRLALRATVAILGCTLLWVAAQLITKSPLLLPGAKGLSEGVVVSLGGAPDVFRPAGFMTHPNVLAHYLVIVFGPALALTLLGPGRVSQRIWWIAAAATLGTSVGLVVTLSRGGWAASMVAAIVVVLVYARSKVISPRQLVILGLAAILGAGLLLAAYPNILLRLTAPDSRSLESRVLLADMAYTIIHAHPWFGVGFGEYNRAAFQFSPPLFANVSLAYQLQLHQLVVHNHYLLFAAELGIPAMLFFVYLLWRFVRLAWPLERWSRPEDFGLAVGLGASMVAQVFFLNSDNYYTDIRIFLLWLSAGVLQALTIIVEREQGRSS
ncbi:O-antigen ligase family protein [Variovorax robiniae]|uniref:O-antigen ligase family protein n=1 Tax=Variovorax robiniae TaxID=1836199 RepID=A0ABU8XKF7_9BURK